MFEKKGRVRLTATALYLTLALTACGVCDGAQAGGGTDAANRPVQAVSVDTIAEMPEYEEIP